MAARAASRAATGASGPREDFVRGVYDSDDEQNEVWKTIPTFATASDCLAFVKQHYNKPSNPEFPYMHHLCTTLVTWSQVRRFLIGKLAQYRVKYPLRPPVPVPPANQFLERVSVVEQLDRRLDLPFHRRLTEESTLNTLRYLFFHMRCGIFVMIRNNKLVMFVPFVNSDYTNNWGHLLRLEGDASVQDYYNRKRAVTDTKEDVLPDKGRWWANGNIICNVQPRNVWGDNYLSQLRHMLQQCCAHRQVSDCEFFINKRDYPHLKADLSEPYDFLYDDATGSVPLTRERYTSYAPITSFYFSDEFADLPFPVTDDWETATGEVFPPVGADARSAAKRESHFVSWEDKVNTALFRGTATGGGTTVDTNQRLRLALLSHQWRTDPRYNEKNEVDGVPFLDAGVVRWNHRDKKLKGQPMTFLDHTTLEFQTVGFMPMYEQMKHKYIVYVEGHCAASRYASMMKMDSVILKVESTTKAKDIWYFPLLEPWQDHVPVCADMSDLAERIEWCKRHDDECRAIAARASELYETFMSKDGIMDYLQILMNRVASRFDHTADPAVDLFGMREGQEDGYAEVGLPSSFPRPSLAPPHAKGAPECPCQPCQEQRAAMEREAASKRGTAASAARNRLGRRRPGKLRGGEKMQAEAAPSDAALATAAAAHAANGTARAPPAAAAAGNLPPGEAGRASMLPAADSKSMPPPPLPPAKRPRVAPAEPSGAAEDADTTLELSEDEEVTIMSKSGEALSQEELLKLAARFRAD